MFMIAVGDQSILMEGECFWPGTIQIGDFAERFLASTELDASIYNDLWKRSARALIEHGGAVCFPTSVDGRYNAGSGCWIAAVVGQEVHFMQILVRPDDLTFDGNLFSPATEAMGQIFQEVAAIEASKWVASRADLVRFAES